MVFQGDPDETKRKTVSTIDVSIRTTFKTDDHDDNGGYHDTELKFKETKSEEVVQITAKQQSSSDHDNLRNNECMLSDVINDAKYNINGNNEHTLQPFPGLFTYTFLFI